VTLLVAGIRRLKRWISSEAMLDPARQGPGEHKKAASFSIKCGLQLRERLALPCHGRKVQAGDGTWLGCSERRSPSGALRVPKGARSFKLCGHDAAVLLLQARCPAALSAAALIRENFCWYMGGMTLTAALLTTVRAAERSRRPTAPESALLPKLQSIEYLHAAGTGPAATSCQHRL
jgi:hypothetical protein